jgi:hypothetical protein
MSDLSDKLQLVCRKLAESSCTSSYVWLSNPALASRLCRPEWHRGSCHYPRYSKHHPEKRGTARPEDQASTSRIKQWNGKNEVRECFQSDLQILVQVSIQLKLVSIQLQGSLLAGMYNRYKALHLQIVRTIRMRSAEMRDCLHSFPIRGEEKQDWVKLASRTSGPYHLRRF